MSKNMLLAKVSVDLLYQALETEKGGTQIYSTALRCAINKDLKEEWNKYLAQTKTHVQVVTDILRRLGLDPNVETPGRKVVRYVGTSLVKAMELAHGDPKKFQPSRVTQAIETSPRLSMVDNPNFPKDNIKTRKIAFLVADGFDHADVSEMKQALLTAGAAVMTVAPRLGMLTGANGEEIKADLSFLTGSSVLFDAVYVPGGGASVAALKSEAEAANFLSEAYKHCKTIAARGAGIELLEKAGVSRRAGEGAKADQPKAQPGIVIKGEGGVGDFGSEFINSIAQHRHWERELAV